MSRMIHAIDISSAIRMTIAASRPVRRARGCVLAGQLARENRDEDDVVDAEHDLEERERDEREEAVGCEKRVHERG